MKPKLIRLGHQTAEYAQRFSDPRYVGQIVFVIIVLLVSWSGVKSIQTNYTLQKQIGSLRQQNDVQKLKNQNLKLQNDYYNSAQYLELAARQNFGLAAAGEKVVLVPQEVALTYVADLPPSKPDPGSQVQPVVRQQNVQAWINFFLHRSTQ